MTIVIEVRSRKDLNDFIRFPLALHARDPFYVPPLIRQMRHHFSRRNPFFDHARVTSFLAVRDGRICGRIVSILNARHIAFHNEKAGFFGFFECIDDDRVAGALLGTVADELRREGMEVMRGPMNFSTNEECGVLIEGFGRHPFFMTPYNPPYYGSLMERCGLQKAKDLYAYILDIPAELPRKINRVADYVAKSGVTVRTLDKKRYDHDMRIFQKVYNSAWAGNWGFIPLTDGELAYLSSNLKPIVVPDLTAIAENRGEPIGFLGMLPDFNRVLKEMRGKLNPLTMVKAFLLARRVKDLRLLLLGVSSEYRNRGVDALLFSEAFKGVKRGGYQRVEFSWILEDNLPVQRLVHMIGGRLYKKYRIYERRL